MNVPTPRDENPSSPEELYLQGKFEAAIQVGEWLMERNGASSELLNLLGACHLNLGDTHKAESRLRQAAMLGPLTADNCNNLGVLYQSTGRLDEAEHWFRLAVSIAPEHYRALLNLGLLLRSRLRLKDAESTVRRAIDIARDSHEALNVLGLVLRDLRRHGEAEAAYRQALSLNPHSALYKVNLGILLLSQNMWGEGLPLFEARHDSGLGAVFSSAAPVPFPRWSGESLEGASLLIWPEQGHGDQIQLVRYVNKIKELGASYVTLVCSDATHSLFSTLREVDLVIAQSQFDSSMCPPHDYWTHIWSIPLNLNEDVDAIPSRVPYLYAPRNSISSWERLIPKGRFRIGLVWKGNPGNPNDVVRSLPDLKTLESLWQTSGVTFVSLQREASAASLQAELGDRFIVNLGSRAADFSDVAAIISRLDLVIGVDTAVTHLAAALGKPTWIMLSSVATDWRWKCSGSTSEWYPDTVTLFRQEVDELDWTGVVRRVADALSMKALRA
ncbi:hypothetical protein GQ56_0104070 [Burkholderia paludis]|uniref:tetratricopeptide repeat-containing glycosyltransferase family protein n=1 Tax=Burkholderia paludis TaxID=1506587 RepID=UPI0004DB7F76|nr:tetratricopeptide repeat-containing glycosyltransferase family protein [Burkholderia paludis]KFG98242.1 hypothetical protein GQ56_0104070 [Burkholderia paludis]